VHQSDDMPVEISAVGPFKVRSSDGADLTPRGRKASCILALLILSPNFRRSRAALQDKLWSDRAPEQGASSLRQALSDIRRSLGHYRDLLQADLRTVSLDPEKISVDLDSLDLSAYSDQAASDLPVLFEGLDIKDPEFENWLRDQRHNFEQQILDLRDDEPDEVVVGTLPQPSVGSARAPENERPWIRLLPQLVSTGDSGAFISRMVGETMVRGIAECGAIEISEQERDAPGLELRVEAMPMPQATCVHVTLFEAHSKAQLWSGTQNIPLDGGFILESPNLQILINQTINIAQMQLHDVLINHPGSYSGTAALAAFQKMYLFNHQELLDADKLLEQAYERDPKGIFLAWRGYAKTFDMGDHRKSDALAQKQEAESLIRKAMEIEPQNSTVLALASYVYSFMMHEYEVGHELAERSLRYNPMNVLGLAFLGRAKSYLGKFEEGYQLAAKAREICGPGPHQHTLDFLCGITAILSNRYEEALRLGEMNRALAPDYRPPQRYLVPLYLQAGKQEKAREVYDNLKKIEPDFSLQAMKEKSYPSAGLRASGLLDHGDKDL